MSKYSSLKSGLKNIEPADAIDAIDRLFERGAVNADTDSENANRGYEEQDAINEQFSNEYPGLQAMGARIIYLLTEGVELPEEQMNMLQTSLALSLIGLREIVAYDELPKFDD